MGGGVGPRKNVNLPKLYLLNIVTKWKKMQLENKKFTIKERPIVKNIENFICNAGYSPLRWSVVKVEGDELTIEATCIRTK